MLHTFHLLLTLIASFSLSSRSTILAENFFPHFSVLFSYIPLIFLIFAHHLVQLLPVHLLRVCLQGPGLEPFGLHKLDQVLGMTGETPNFCLDFLPLQPPDLLLDFRAPGQSVKRLTAGQRCKFKLLHLCKVNSMLFVVFASRLLLGAEGNEVVQTPVFCDLCRGFGQSFLDLHRLLTDVGKRSGASISSHLLPRALEFFP